MDLNFEAFEQRMEARRKREEAEAAAAQETPEELKEAYMDRTGRTVEKSWDGPAPATRVTGSNMRTMPRK